MVYILEIRVDTVDIFNNLHKMVVIYPDKATTINDINQFNDLRLDPYVHTHVKLGIVRPNNDHMFYASIGALNKPKQLKLFLNGTGRFNTTSTSRTSYNLARLLSLSGGRLVAVNDISAISTDAKYHHTINPTAKCTVGFIKFGNEVLETLDAQNIFLKSKIIDVTKDMASSFFRDEQLRIPLVIGEKVNGMTIIYNKVSPEISKIPFIQVFHMCSIERTNTFQWNIYNIELLLNDICCGTFLLLERVGDNIKCQFTDENDSREISFNIQKLHNFVSNHNLIKDKFTKKTAYAIDFWNSNFQKAHAALHADPERVI